MKGLVVLTVCAVSLGAAAQTTFNVDMTCAPEFDNVFVSGPWCGWCANDVYNTMTDPDGDGIYTVTLDETVTGLIEYKYAINGWEDQENLVNDMNDGATCCACDRLHQLRQSNDSTRFGGKRFLRHMRRHMQ